MTIYYLFTIPGRFPHAFVVAHSRLHDVPPLWTLCRALYRCDLISQQFPRQIDLAEPLGARPGDQVGVAHAAAVSPDLGEHAWMDGKGHARLQYCFVRLGDGPEVEHVETDEMTGAER